MSETIPLGQSTKPEVLWLKLANRHGLVTGATGTGKTVTLQTLAEGFSSAGVPVFAADIKGDLSGISAPGEEKEFITNRLNQMGVTDWAPAATPVIFWDLFGEQGHPIRTTITEMGPLMLSRLMGLTEAQEGALNIAFRIADEEGLALLDMADLRAMLADLADRGSAIRTQYGNVSAATIGAIQRALIVLEEQGGNHFFGEPALDIREFLRTTRDGRGMVNLLAADKLMQSPRLYATFLLWLLSELFEVLPEAGDPDRPRLVFFFDEAHLLFDDAPKGLVDKVEQVVKLVRSKGVGVYFVTQNPIDIPDAVLSQLGNRVQHALRAYTPRDQKAVKVAADTFRANPAFDTQTLITQLGKGEALVSVLDPKAVPNMVEHTLIRPPVGRIGPISEAERQQIIRQSPVAGLYDVMKDRESAAEILAVRAKQNAEAAAAAQEAKKKPTKEPESETARMARNIATSAGRSVASAIGRQVGQAIIRGVLGSLLR